MRILGTQEAKGLVVITNIEGTLFLRVTQQRPSVVSDLNEATPLSEPLAHELLAMAASDSVLSRFPEVERFVARAVIRPVEAEYVVIEVSGEDDSEEQEEVASAQFTAEDLAPTRVLH